MTHIRGLHSRITSFLGIILLVTFGIFSTLGSGGGGGDGDSSTTVQPLAYDGNEAAAIITKDNATALLSNVLFGNMAGGAIPVGVATSTSSQLTDTSQLVDRLTSLYMLEPIIVVASDTNSQLPVAAIEPVCVSGSFSVSGTLNPDYTGTVTVTFSNCLLSTGITYNGTAVVTFHTVDISDPFNPIPTNVTMRFSPRMTIISSDPDHVLNMSTTGTMTLNIVLNVDKETIELVSLVTRNNNSGIMAWYVNFVITTTYDDIMNPNSVLSQTFEGRAYEYTHGYVDVTTSPGGELAYSNITLLFPDSGGPIWFVGGPPAVEDDPTRIQASVTDAVWISIDLDIDGDGSNGIDGFEITGCPLKWEDLFNPQPLVNCPPVE